MARTRRISDQAESQLYKAIAVVVFLIVPFVAPTVILPFLERIGALATTGPINYGQASLSILALFFSLLLALQLSDSLRGRTEGYMNGPGPWVDVVKWREWLAAIPAALLALILSVAQSKALSEDPRFTYYFAGIVGISILFLVFFLVSTEPKTLKSTWSYWWHVYLAVLLPHMLAAIVVLLPTATSSVGAAACRGVVIDTPPVGTTWTNSSESQQYLSGSAPDVKYKDWLHVFAMYVTNRYGDRNEKQMYWYGGKVNIRTDGKWTTPQLYVADVDTIDFTIVAVDPETAGKAMIDYRNAAVALNQDNGSVVFTGGLPKDMVACGSVRVYGKAAKP